MCQERPVVNDAEPFVAELKKKPGKDVWLWGGGELFHSLLSAGLVDGVDVGVMPVLLGGGIPLFGALKRKLNFSCTDSRIFLGRVVQNRYERIRP